MPVFDVVTLGETMLRLTPPFAARLDQATRFDIEVGGTESNTAVGLSRLGLACTWLSRLPDSPLGDLVCETLNKHGVDTSHVVRTQGNRMGVYFYEDAPTPRQSRVVYDRQHSAASELRPQDIPADLFTESTPRLLHLTGITPAISDSALQTSRHAIKMANAANVDVSFDTNYRATLWSAQEARQEMTAQMRQVRIIITSMADLTSVFDTPDDPVAALKWLRGEFPNQVCVVTRGSNGAIACTPGEESIERAAIPTTPVGRLGGGDAFSAGFLYGWLSFDAGPDKLRQCLDWAVAAASLKYATPGDMAVIDRNEIAALLERGNQTVSVRR